MKMNEKRMEAALLGLGGQKPRIPELTIENMVKTVRALNKERVKRYGVQAEPEKPVRQSQKELTLKNPVKNNIKTL